MFSLKRSVISDEDQEPPADDSSSDVTGGGQNNPMSNQLEQIIQRLPTCVNKDFIDDVSTASFKIWNQTSVRSVPCSSTY